MTEALSVIPNGRASSYPSEMPLTLQAFKLFMHHERQAIPVGRLLKCAIGIELKAECSQHVRVGQGLDWRTPSPEKDERVQWAQVKPHSAP